VIVGRTNLPELAQAGQYTEGIAFGATRNPHDLTRTPGGSSGGSAAAVAAGLVPAALGSDGGASIRVPAALCGIFGLKPQRGRVPLAPLADHWQGMTVLGPLTRTVADAALFMEAVAPGGWPQIAAEDPGRLRIEVVTKPIAPVPVAPGMRNAVHRTADRLRALGHDVVERDVRWPPAFLALAIPRYYAGIAEDADRLDARERLEPRTRHAAAIGRFERGLPLRLSHNAERRTAARLPNPPVLLMPVVAWGAPRVGRWSGRGNLTTFSTMLPWTCFTSIWNYVGRPAAAVPAGTDRNGMPVGVQLVGRAGDEATLLRVSAQLERL
jgi:amidase